MNRREKEFSEFYHRHYEKIFRFVRAKKFPYNHISDLVGKIFEKAWRRFDEYTARSEETKKYWIYDIARDTCRYEWTRAKRRQEFLSEDVETVFRNDDKNPVLDTYISSEWRRQFLKIILDLPDKQKEVVMLKLEGYKYVEMGELLNISSQACRKRMATAISNLKGPLAKLLETNPDIMKVFSDSASFKG